MPSLLRGVFLALLLTALVGYATLGAPATWQPGNLEGLTIRWQQYFRIQWTASRSGGMTIIDGYITNTWGFTAQRVRVLVNGYDGSGRQVGQVVAWGPNEIEPGGRVYFNVTIPEGAANYDVSIFSWNWVQVGSKP